MMLAIVLSLSQALSNVVCSASVRQAVADYQENKLRIEQVRADEMKALDRRGGLQFLPVSMPFQLAVGPTEADLQMARRAVGTITNSIPQNLQRYFCERKVMAPVTRWLLSWCRPGVDSDDDYVSAKAHPAVWQAKDFDLETLAAASAALSSNSVPIIVRLRQMYGECEPTPISRAQPLVDYPDSRDETTFETPYGIAIMLRAPERRRKFRFAAVSWPVRDWRVEFRWVWLTPGRGQGPSNVQYRQELSPKKGYAEVTVDWAAARRERLDLAVFARYGNGHWGPPSIISFAAVPNENRAYDGRGNVERIEYRKSSGVIPALYQNKPWTDVYNYDDFGNVMGIGRTRTGMFRDEPFSALGDLVVETYASGYPKVVRKVRYATASDDPATLDYEIAGDEIKCQDGAATLRDRGEFPRAKPRHR